MRPIPAALHSLRERAIAHEGEIMIASAKGKHLDAVKREPAKHAENHGEH